MIIYRRTTRNIRLSLLIIILAFSEYDIAVHNGYVVTRCVAGQWIRTNIIPIITLFMLAYIGYYIVILLFIFYFFTARIIRNVGDGDGGCRQCFDGRRRFKGPLKPFNMSNVFTTLRSRLYYTYIYVYTTQVKADIISYYNVAFQTPQVYVCIYYTIYNKHIYIRRV